jgi:hypothetical protein
MWDVAWYRPRTARAELAGLVTDPKHERPPETDPQLFALVLMLRNMTVGIELDQAERDPLTVHDAHVHAVPDSLEVERIRIAERAHGASLATTFTGPGNTADASGVTFLPRYSVSIMVILAATTATFAVFTFARPEYHPRYESKKIDFSTQDYHSPADVRQAFSTHGIKLRGVDSPAPGFLWLSNSPPPWPADALQVLIAPHNGKGSWGPRLEPYDERFGNVMVTYGRKDERMLDRVKAAVSALR